MWVDFEKIELRSDLTSTKGRKYSAYIVSGNKRGWGDEPDDPTWSKPVFPDAMSKVIDRNGEMEMALHEFFEMCEPGDLIAIENKKENGYWRMVSVENKTRPVLSKNQTSQQEAQPQAVSGPDTLSAATTFVMGLIQNGYYEKGKPSIEVILDEIGQYSMRMQSLVSAYALSAEG